MRIGVAVFAEYITVDSDGVSQRRGGEVLWGSHDQQFVAIGEGFTRKTTLASHGVDPALYLCFVAGTGRHLYETWNNIHVGQKCVK